MEASEGGEEVAVASGGEGDAGVAEQEGEDAGEGGDHDKHGGETSGEGSCGSSLSWPGATHGGEKQRQGDEGADTDHVEHVDGEGAGKSEGAGELGLGLGWGSITAVYLYDEWLSMRLADRLKFRPGRPI